MRVSSSNLEKLHSTAGADLVRLGLEDERGLTLAGQVLLAEEMEQPPAALGFRVSRMPVSLLDEDECDPLETVLRTAPCLEWLDALALEIAADLAPALDGRALDATVRVAREVLTNAVVHRDYTVESPIQVDRYVDGVSVYSPGLPVGATVQDGTWSGRGTRNRQLVYGAKCLGYGWAQGRGWPTCERLAHGFGLWLSVQLLEDGVQVFLEPNVERQLDLERKRETRVRHVSTTWDEVVLDVLSDGEWWRPGEIAARGDVPRSSLSQALKRLEEAGRVERSEALARSPNQRWRSLGSVRQGGVGGSDQS